MIPDLRRRVEGGLLGLLVGDALGVPYEFHAPEALPPADQLDMPPPAGFRRAHAGVPPGTWSDDGAQALVLLDRLLANDGLDLRHFADGLLRWRHEGFHAVDGRVFDIGIQTSTALDRLRAGVPPQEAGPVGERHNGNGALMRVLPLALWHRGDDDELVALAMRQALPTHGHAWSRVACAHYCLWARAELRDDIDSWRTAEARTRALLSDAPWLRDAVERVLDPANAAAARGTGFVIDTLWSAKHAVESTGDYETCVRRAIAYGHDTDTTACVAGGIAGIRHGVDAIPRRWLDALRAREVVAALLDRLTADV